MDDDIAAGTNRRFHYVTSTTASEEEIWRHWTHVASWKRWDHGLAAATIDGPFVQGANGTLIPNTGRDATFTIVDLDPGRSYTFDTKLPGARLRIRRDFVGGPTPTFRHEVSFEGPLAVVWSVLLGRGFRRQLPGSMSLLAEQAEAR